MRIASLLVVCLALASHSFAAGVRDLPPKYRDWLQKDVAYIITDEEKGAFLNLAADADRDQFISRFWEIRNPNPGAPTNSYREEHYRRLEYANQYFGHENHGEGWRTIKGRIYITLGEPKQKAVYLGLQKIRPMEIWFYSNAHPALPPFFYIVFYKREDIGDFQLYSPYFDGPDKLITTIRATNDRNAALKIIDQSAGREVARTVLSLIPDEPVDMNNPQPSLQSDVMLSTIRALANNPLTKQELNNRRQILEAVSHRVILGTDSLNALTLPLRDREGNTNLHFVIRVRRPQDFAVAENKGANDKAKQYYVSMNAKARVFDANNKLIFEQDRPVSQYFNDQQMTRVKNKALGYAGVLPLPPGKYRIEFLLTNNVTHTSYRTEQAAVVPAPDSRMTIAGLVPFTEAETNSNSASALVPFGIGGVRFTPVAAPVAELSSGEDLKVFYQIWAPKQDTGPGKKIIVNYAYGRPGTRGDAKVIEDEVIAEQFDGSGSLLNGKKIPVSDLPPGNYRLSVSITDPDTQAKTFAAMAFRIVAGEGSPAGWDLYDDEANTSLKNGSADYQRALCYLAGGDTANALTWLQRSLEKNATEETRAKLVDIHYARKEFAQVAALYQRLPISKQTNEQTMLRIAASLDKLGKTQAAIEALEGSLRFNEPTAPLYLTLASYYQQLGNSAKARELEVKAKLLLPKANTPIS